MGIIPVLVVGSMVYAGYRTFASARPKKTVTWVQQSDGRYAKKSIPAQETINHSQIQEAVNRDFTVSSISLGLAASGAIIYAPLVLASVPLTIYGLIPMVEHSLQGLFKKGEGAMVAAGSIVVAITLLANHFVLAAMIEWLYFLNRKLWFELASSYSQFIAYALGHRPITVWILVDGVEVEIPLEDLRPGDTVVTNGEAVT